MNSLKFEQTDVNLVNHSVKPNGAELLPFFFPDFKVVNDNCLIIDCPIIYTGPVKYLNRLKSFEQPIISVTTLGEFDLTDARTLVNMTYTKWHQDVPDRLAKYVDKLDYNEILEAVKIHWVTGKWPIKKYNKSGAFVHLLEAFSVDTYTALTTYLELLQSKYTSRSLF